MREAGIGRVLVASLHQGIADILPTRLSFYENWLNAEGLREGTIGLAPLYAVLSFLRQEGEAYQMITTRAGEYAAEWTVASMPPLQRAAIKARSEEHTSELQSLAYLVCRLLLEKKKIRQRPDARPRTSLDAGPARRSAAHAVRE